MNVIVYPTAAKFISNLDYKTKQKISDILSYIAYNKGKLSEPYTKKVYEDIYEIRVLSKIQIRIFYTYRSDVIFVLHGFVKKTKKLPTKEIRRAISILKEFDNYNI